MPQQNRFLRACFAEPCQGCGKRAGGKGRFLYGATRRRLSVDKKQGVKRICSWLRRLSNSILVCILLRLKLRVGAHG